MNNDKSIKLKLTLGYILLGATALFSIWYLLTEIKKINSPREELLRENDVIFAVGNTINTIYGTESIGRIALITTSNKDINRYKNQLDSVKKQLNNFKDLIDNELIIHKIDTIQILLSDKEKNFNEIVYLKKKYINSDNFNQAFEKFRNEKKKLDSYADVNIENVQSEKKSLIQRIFNSTDEEEEKRNLEKVIQNRIKIEEQHQLKRDSLANQAEQIFNEAIQKESKLQNQYIEKEERLFIENKYLTEEIKLLLAQIEQNVIDNSTEKIRISKEKIEKTTTDVIYVGAVALLFVIILGFIVIRDLNRSHRYKKELELLNSDLEKLMRQKSMFFATVTHDIVSPLNSLVGFTELLENTLQTKTQKKYIKNIKYSTAYIRNLSNDLIDFSKLEYNKIVLKKQTFQFLELMESTFEPLTDTANQKNIDLNYKIDESLNDYFYSDPYRIKQILTNITTNAIKFTNQGEVMVDATIENNEIKITIEDTGIGIEKEHQSEIFKEFKQAHGAIEKIYGGTGLGLNISKGLVELLGGRIAFESEYGKGTRFTIYLPKVRKTIDSVENNKLYFDNDKQLIHKKILIIDDDSMQLQLISEILKDKVAQISTLNNGELLDSILQTESFDLIVSDIQMPNCNGYQIIEKIRSNTAYQNIPVIAFTGKIDLDEKEFQKLGFNAVIHKPIEIDNLLFEIHRILEINIVNQTTKNEIQKNFDFDDFSLTKIFAFCDNDETAAKNIINLFIEETFENIEQLESASFEYDLKSIENISHKMLPMFKQLEIISLVGKLFKLEREAQNFDKESLIKYVSILKIEIEQIIYKIQKVEL
ncbi:response regulator [Paenimyroides tangerinum]|uniref:histidine kinase n=1 Tax=Paenimyroides tangerinum TaxID=2488728 RepID=A0A3P3W2L0_9FLAO|nr:ATP-binding protein [Paenimyroides tangerinum]RRJ89295.1 response regulator [Paenimyroides tangerinum]